MKVRFLMVAAIVALVVSSASMVLCAQEKIVLVRGTASPGGQPQSDYNKYCEKVAARLRAAGLSFSQMSDGKLAREQFAGVRLAIFPYNGHLSESSAAAVKDYVDGGGKLVVFYTSDKQLLSLVGISTVEFVTGERLEGASGVRFEPGVIPGLPPFMAQTSGNILHPTLEKGTFILGRWCAGDSPLPLIAATSNRNGVYFSHVLLGHDKRATERFLIALADHYVPGIWHALAARNLESVGKINGLENLNALIDKVRTNGAPQANVIVTDAARLAKEAEALLARNEDIKAYDAVAAAQTKASEAYMAIVPSRTNELRGVWIHSGYGLRGKSWDESIKLLAESGFNALFVNLCWGYCADYKSAVLPVSPLVEKRGDQLKLCLAACRKYGVQLHVWKVCWNMGHRTPKNVIDELARQGRTQQSSDGKNSKYLAPHLPENFKLEKDAFLELVREHDIDGIHFDYIRYPDGKCDFSPSARAAFEKSLGKTVSKWPDDCMSGGTLRPEYNEWRRANISRLVESVSNEARAIRKNISISAAVFGAWDGARDGVAQDTELWLEKGWLDFVCPMNYTDSEKSLRSWLERQIACPHRHVPLYAGLGTYRLDGPEACASQILLARALGADGFVCFDFQSLYTNELLRPLHLGVTALPAGKLMPHQSPLASCRVPKGRPELDGHITLRDTARVEVLLPRSVRLTRDFKVNLEVDGVDVTQPLKVRPARGGVSVVFKPERAGSYRVKMLDERQNFISRSPSFRVLSEEEEAETRRRNGPPQFARNGGIRVAVWHDDAYGAQNILEALGRMKGVDAAVLYNFRPENLKPCQVIILPQPRNRIPLFRHPDVLEALRAFTRAGGGLMTTHALVGIRNFTNLFPEVVRDKSPKPVNVTEWKGTRHSITRSLPTQPQQSTFVDMIVMEPADGATGIINTPDGLCAMTVGNVGRGRYAACGVGLGITRGDKDAPLTPAENTLLFNTVRWLAKTIR